MTGWISLLGMSSYSTPTQKGLVDFPDICSLPFYDENSCALGNVIKTYLDELCTFDDPTSISTRAEMKTRCQGWFQYCDCEGSIDEALHLWDAVC